MKKKSKVQKRQVNNSNDLNWKPVDDDYDLGSGDGIFYGLEEIDGVEVQTEGGGVSFLVADSTDLENEIKDETRVVKGKNNSSDIKTKSSKKEEQLSGFSHLESSAGAQVEVEIESLGSWPSLDPAILGALKSVGYENPTKIQQECIPTVLDGKDLIGKAATGSGKTLAYGLPIIEAFLAKPDTPVALIIAPTRELAHQIKDHMNAIISKAVTEHTSGVVALTGGLAIQKQLRLLENNPVAIVGTPGRLLQVLEQMPGTKRNVYTAISTIVLDEADRLVQSNSFEELGNILDILGRGKHQTLVFSATFEPDLWSQLAKGKRRRSLDIRQVLQEKLGLNKNARFIDVDPEQTVAENIVQSVIECPAMEKDSYLYYFGLLYPGKTIVFVNSVDAVKRIVPLLKELKLEAFGVHSDMMQKQRLRSLERFAATKSSVLVATDVAARGLDIPKVDHVVHYHLPRTADMYVHRSGRTARAGARGVSVVLCSPDEVRPLAGLQKLVSTQLKEFTVDLTVLARLKERVLLAKRIADANSSKAHKGKANGWLDQAAEDLGIDLSDSERELIMGNKKVSTQSDSDTRVLRAELESLLSRKVAPNRKYLTAGTFNMAQAMLAQPDAVVPGKAIVSALDELAPRKKSKK
ncbi:ATP-dependent RNA helicase MAK5 [Wickerhamiella sorbophila]|uniref:RNA helicase n=1 Tax=Wickerhamiella sorbophila TaxID=45607 RepID=A0A2T0FFV7_9ASCO|nr:ATP-dependent RNA helicase MAK5 [Wickerhamiella sorbophila]PRT53864.1 ATP-dependent RNA helicase MAK5 [Wickerhamiella sorbophila]